MTVPVLEFEGVRVWTPEGVHLLRGIDWRVDAGQHWAILGQNGAGKSTLLSLAAARRHPSAGTVSVLGKRLGQTMVWRLWEHIGVIDSAMKMPDELTAEVAVLTGLTGTPRPQWDRLGAAEEAHAIELLTLLGCAQLIGRNVGSCSQGERQRLRIARALMPNPELLLLDEPATGLDLPAREALLTAIADLASSNPDLAVVVVAHHLEDLPATTSHALLLRSGSVLARGSAEEILTSDLVSEAFAIPVTVDHHGGRWSARAEPGWNRHAIPAAARK
jgi:iron complex transport system ATP-binding protein